MSIVYHLSQVPLFSCLDKKTCDALTADPKTVCLTVEDGETVAFGQTMTEEPFLAVLVSGTLTVSRERENARILLNEIRAPGIVGVSALFGDGPLPDTTVAVKKHAVLYLFGQSRIEKLIRENGVFAFSYIRFLSDRIRFLNERIASFTSGAAEDRLLRYLITNADGGIVHISRTRLAEELDIGRASLYRAIDELMNRGLIRTDGKTIELLLSESEKGRE